MVQELCVAVDKVVVLIDPYDAVVEPCEDISVLLKVGLDGVEG